MKKQHQKPKGEIGPTLLSKEKIEFDPVDFPKTKEEIESFIVKAFIKQSQLQDQLPFSVNKIQQNELDDFDYSLRTSNGLKYLELMEIAPLESLKGSYEKAPNSYSPYNFAEFIFNKMMNKSTRYKGSKESGIYLLLYITHWSFILSDTTISLLQYWTMKSDNSFEGIFCYSPIDKDNGVIHEIFPSPVEFPNNFNPERYRYNIVHNLSPIKWKSSSE